MKGIRLDHIGIAVNDLQQGAKFWELLGLIPSKDVEVNEEGIYQYNYPYYEYMKEGDLIYEPLFLNYNKSKNIGSINL